MLTCALKWQTSYHFSVKVFKTIKVTVKMKCIIQHFQNQLRCFFQQNHHISLETEDISFSSPRLSEHGELSTNAAFTMAKKCRMSPKILAENIQKLFQNDALIQRTEIAGAGFLNIWLTSETWHEIFKRMLCAKNTYGQCALGKNQRLNIEFVSANPTGPLHAGHALGAVVGDVLANILSFSGWNVQREYYINDRGMQVQHLASSVYTRYAALCGQTIQIDGGDQYPGEYIDVIASAIYQTDGASWMHAEENNWRQHFRMMAVQHILDQIQKDLHQLGIHFDVWTSEAVLEQNQAFHQTLTTLQNEGLAGMAHMPQPRANCPQEYSDAQLTEACVFYASHLGAEGDYVLKKSNGDWTYFMGDIAYHADKFRRGFQKMINIWGADHGGHVMRLEKALDVMTQGQAHLHVVLCQMVRFMDGTQPLVMSKRAGTFITLSDIIQKVGSDAFRFLLLMRRTDSHVTFDVHEALSLSPDNPIFYVQYAHARAHSAMRMAHDVFGAEKFTLSALEQANFHLFSTEDWSLIAKLAEWPEVLAQAAKTYEPHRIATYAYALASAFHALWTMGKTSAHLRFTHPNHLERTQAKIALVHMTATVLCIVLQLCGIQAMTEIGQADLCDD